MLESDKEKIKDLSTSSMRLGFHMGVIAMRLKVMETIVPYLDEQVIESDLLTKRDALRLALEAISDFNSEIEFERMKIVVDRNGLQSFFDEGKNV